jgi:cell division cycle protein 20 (cofactor of APC complex)
VQYLGISLWIAGTGDIEELCNFDDGDRSGNAHISSISWVQQGGSHLAVGTNGRQTELWGVNECKRLRSVNGHSDRVGALAWDRHSRDTVVVNRDVLVARHKVATMQCHEQEACGLSWSPSQWRYARQWWQCQSLVSLGCCRQW